VPPLPLRSRAALAASRVAGALSTRLGRGRGTVIGGAIAERIDPGLLARLGRDRTTVFLSATNGKSTTAALLAAAVRATLGRAVHNEGGSNMASGLIVALDADRDAGYAILEVDELYLGPLSRALQPRVITLMNLARDYLERGVRYKRLVRHWREAVAAIGRARSSRTRTIRSSPGRSAGHAAPARPSWSGWRAATAGPATGWSAATTSWPSGPTRAPCRRAIGGASAAASAAPSRPGRSSTASSTVRRPWRAGSRSRSPWTSACRAA
jgi:hypothetical protein